MMHFPSRLSPPAAALLLSFTAVVAPGCGGVDDGTSRFNPVVEEPERAEVKLEVKLEVDRDQQFQTIEGFGAAVAWYGFYLSEHPNRDELYDLLFPELGADIVRLRNTYGRQEGPDFAADVSQIVAGASAALGRPVQIQMSSWSPPPELKDNAETRCDNVCANGGDDCVSAQCTLSRNDAGEFDYAGFADYWYDSLQAYAEVGVEPNWISIQNEPDYLPNGWEGCRFEPTEESGFAGYDQALSAVYERLLGMAEPPKLLGPETLGVHNNKAVRYSVGMNRDHIYGVAHHLYEGSAWAYPDGYSQWLTGVAERYEGLPIFQTEFGEGGFFETAWLIHNSMVDASSVAYLYWELIWEGRGLISLENPWDEEEWSTERGYTISPQYYAMRHFARFTDPGYVRVAVTSSEDDVRASAYESPDENVLTLVLLNVGNHQRKIEYALDGFDPVSALGFWSDSSDTWQPLEDVSSENEGELTLPGRSIVTLVAQR
jgi:glucuronoarabinoxylan endo-1,4-beta-xylanase